METFVHPMRDLYDKKYYPIVDENSKILILGSFPSKHKDDIEADYFYYGSDRNRFWHYIVRLFVEPYNKSPSYCYSEIEAGKEIDEYIKKMNPEEKAALLKMNSIALWDIVDVCNSSTEKWPTDDTHIQPLEFNKIPELLEKYKRIEKVFFTGNEKIKIKKNMAKKIKLECREEIIVDHLYSPALRSINKVKCGPEKHFENWQKLLKPLDK